MDFDQLSRSYLGKNAATYDKKRTRLTKWVAEQNIVEDFLGHLPRGSQVLDIPVGTGRFISAYQRLGIIATGIDASPDMQMVAKRKADNLNYDMLFQAGDIRRIPFDGDTFDTVVCICFLNWIDMDGVRTVLKELVRVTRKDIILSIRFYASREELMTLTGVSQWCLQQLVRPYKAFVDRKLVLHEKSDVISLFSSLGLRIKESTKLVERKYGTDYMIFSLEKLS